MVEVSNTINNTKEIFELLSLDKKITDKEIEDFLIESIHKI